MEKGAFIVSQHKEFPKEILFNITENIPSSNQLILKGDIEKALVVLQNIFKDDNKSYMQYFFQILSLAQAGLAGANANPVVALQALANLKYDIVVKMSGIIKNKYMIKLGIYSIAFCLFFVLISFVSYYNNWSSTIYLILIASSMPGVWLSFGARKTQLSFENLHIIEEDRLEPVIRLSFAGLLTLIIGLLFSLGVVNIELGSISTFDINSDFRVTVLIGLLCGFSEQVLSEKVKKYAVELLKN